MELKTFTICALQHYMENDCMYVEIIAVVFVVKVAETNQTKHRFTHQKYMVSLVVLYFYLSPRYLLSYSTHCWKGGQIIPSFYITKLATILCGNWFVIVGRFTIAKLHTCISLYISDATLLVLFSCPICSTLLSPCENVRAFLPNVSIREHPSYAIGSSKTPALTVAWKLVVRIISTKNLPKSWGRVSLTEDNPRKIDGKAHRQYAFNKKNLNYR